MNRESAYWMALAHDLPAWSFSDKEAWKNEDRNNLIIKFFHDNKISVEEFFNLTEKQWKDDYGLNDRKVAELTQAKDAVANNAFIAESLDNQGYEVIPIVSPEYSKILKANLKKSAPVVLYIKGNRAVLQEKSIAIVGSRDASETALKFTDNIARQASKEYKVIVSGFARGVDKQALDSAIAYKGQSIIVLPQGITTFGSGFKTYYRQITEGDVLVLSIFHPQAGWNAGLAMARNPIIYGLADEIFVAESADKGGTWEGVLDGLNKIKKGLRKDGTIFVRQPEKSEKNANALLIAKGAVAVDFYGNKLQIKEYAPQEFYSQVVAEPAVPYASFPERIKQILLNGKLSIKEIHRKLNFDKSEQVLKTELNKLD
ncbi:MAG: DNA-processing protein DprA, partial [Tannerella sp.]|nr:DNA-processing protein DprA [Tannerella sp.]